MSGTGFAVFVPSTGRSGHAVTRTGKLQRQRTFGGPVTNLNHHMAGTEPLSCGVQTIFVPARVPLRNLRRRRGGMRQGRQGRWGRSGRGAPKRGGPGGVAGGQK